MPAAARRCCWLPLLLPLATAAATAAVQRLGLVSWLRPDLPITTVSSVRSDCPSMSLPSWRLTAHQRLSSCRLAALPAVARALGALEPRGPAVRDAILRPLAQLAQFQASPAVGLCSAQQRPLPTSYHALAACAHVIWPSRC